VWVGTLHPRTTVLWGEKRQSVKELAVRLRLRWRSQLGGRRSGGGRLHAQVRLRAVGRDQKPSWQLRVRVVTNEFRADLTSVIICKRSRWSVETVFQDTKQYAGLEACQCWVDQAMVRHVVGLVFLIFVVLQMMRRNPRESVGVVSRNAGRWRWWGMANCRRFSSMPVHLIYVPPRKSCNLREESER
jgi:hypothetical protein